MVSGKLEIMVKTGRLANEILKNKKQTSLLPKNRLELYKLEGKIYREFGLFDDGKGYYDLIEDVRVDKDPVKDNLGRLCWMIGDYADHGFGRWDRITKGLRESDDARREIDSMVRTHDHIDYISQFKKKMIDRKLTKKEYLKALNFSPSEFILEMIKRHKDRLYAKGEDSYKISWSEEISKRIDDDVANIAKGHRIELKKLRKELE